jgi:DNA-binding winged helix-turn-helix (wHTH) protein
MIRFGVFELDTRTGELRNRGVKLKLTGQAYRILHALMQHPTEVVTREQLKEILWPDRNFVDSDCGINNSVSHLRTVLGDSCENLRFIETLSPARVQKWQMHQKRQTIRQAWRR